MAARNEQFQKLVGELQRQVSDSFAPGERLPSRRDLAAMYGVGATTIDRALKSLSKTGLVHPSTRIGWFRAATAAGARETSRPPAGLRVGIMSRYSRVEWNSPLYQAIFAEARRRHIQIVEVPNRHRHRPTPGRSRIQLSRVPWNSFDVGLLLDAEDTIIAEAPALKERRVLCVEYDGTRQGLDSVAFDDFGVGAMTARHLVELGHRRFAVTEDLNDPGIASDPNVNARRLGFEAEIGRHGGIIMPEWRIMMPRRVWKLRRGDYTAAAAARWAAAPPNDRPTALFSTCGSLRELIHVLGQHRLRVPGDISMMAVCEEGPELVVNGMRLTRIDLRVSSLASRVFDAAEELFRERGKPGSSSRPPRMTFAPTLLVPGQTTTAPPSGS